MAGLLRRPISIARSSLFRKASRTDSGPARTPSAKSASPAGLVSGPAGDADLADGVRAGPESVRDALRNNDDLAMEIGRRKSPAMQQRDAHRRKIIRAHRTIVGDGCFGAGLPLAGKANSGDTSFAAQRRNADPAGGADGR